MEDAWLKFVEGVEDNIDKYLQENGDVETAITEITRIKNKVDDETAIKLLDYCIKRLERRNHDK